MITLTAKINLLKGNNDKIDIPLYDALKNNISSDLRAIKGVKTNPTNPFIIGASKLNSGSIFSGNVDYFISAELSDNEGFFANEIYIDIESIEPLNTITLAFDTLNNRHPKNIKCIFNINSQSELGQLGHYGEVEYPIRTNLNLPVNAYDVKIISAETGGIKYSVEDLTFSNGEIQGKIVVFVGEGNEEQYLDMNMDISFVVEYFLPFKDDDAIFTLINLPNSNAFSIYIDNWNTPNYPLVLTGIYTAIDINIDYRNLISISRSIFDRSDLKLPSYGIISNTGNIEFNDTDGEILDYAEQLLLEKGLKCEITLKNTLVEGANQTIGLFETDQWNYDNDSRVVSVSIKDDLEEWQEINVAEISYDPRNTESKPFSWLYEHLWELTSNRNSYVNANGETITAKGNYNMFSIVELDEDTQAVLNNTYIQYPLLESGSLWQQWTKLCQVCQLHIYKNNDGVIVCRYNGGN
jgi:hypothetical protein